MAKHRKLTKTAMAAARVTAAGAGLALGGVVLAGGPAAFAATPAQNAAPMAAAHHNDSATNGDNTDGWSQSQSLVDLSHNSIPVQVCHNQVPVNVLGVQVPVQDVTAGLGLGVLGAAGTGAAATDSSCHLSSAQSN